MSEDWVVRIFIGVLALLVTCAVGVGIYAITHPTDEDCDVALIQMPSGTGTTHLQPIADCEDSE